jgi:Zinc finger, C2H2 type
MTECLQCGRQFKDKRGLTIHLKVCDGVIASVICSHCNESFANPYSLSVHQSRCKVLKQKKYDLELETKQKAIVKLEETQDKNNQLQLKIAELERIHLQLLSDKENEISDLKEKHRIDVAQQLRIREHDFISLNKEVERLTTEAKLKDQKIDNLSEQLDEFKVRERELFALYTKERQKDTTTIINQNDNRVQMQCFDPSMIQGKIDPPGYVIGSVNDLMNMLRSLGVRNTYRVNDKSRGTLTWNKPEEGDVKDPTGEQLMNHIIDILNDDLVKEKSYYEEELKYQCEQEDPDMYLMNESRIFITFCNQLIKKDPMILKKFKSQLIKQGKSIKDTQEDQIRETTYIKFTTAITLALFSNVYDWIEMSFYDIGRHIGSKIRDHYHLEGASKESLYIVIHSDNNYNKQIRVKKLVPFISEAVSPYIDDELVESLLSSLLLNNKYLNRENVEKNLQYLKNPTVEATEEIMKGIVSI